MTHNFFYPPPQPGLLIFRGADRVDFIQRQSTNDVRLVTDQSVVPNVLTNAAARILDVCQLFQFDEQSIGALTLDGRGAQTAHFLKRRIFFNDKVTLEDVSQSYRQVLVEGDGLKKIGFPTPGVDQKAEQDGVFVLGQRGVSATSFRVVLENAKFDQFIQSLKDAAIPEIETTAYEGFRVQAGIPGPAMELTETYTPLEANLGYAISDNKGCYTGQEVIARQITYDKITKTLVRVKLEQLAPAGESISVDGKSAGTLTSIAETPDGVFGLAVLKRPHNTSGVAISLAGIKGEVLG